MLDQRTGNRNVFVLHDEAALRSFMRMRQGTSGTRLSSAMGMLEALSVATRKAEAARDILPAASALFMDGSAAY